MLCVEFIVVTATVGIVQCYCVLGGVYFVYSYSRYSAMFLCSVCSFFVVIAAVDIVQWYCVLL